jgi:hypothetical protein
VNEVYEDLLFGGKHRMSQQAVGLKNRGTRKHHGRLCSNESPSNRKVITGRNLFYAIDKFDRIIGYYDLKELLQPAHYYFKDKKGWIAGYRKYQPEDRILSYLYPIISGKDGRLPRDNPYRKHQLAESHTARRINMVIKLIEKFKLNEFKMAFVTLTMPSEMSLWLSEQNRVKKVKNIKTKQISLKKYNAGIDMAWIMYQRFWNWYDDYFGGGLSGSVNLHTWKTKKPLEPHYHFHCLIPNYRKEKLPWNDDDNQEVYGFVKQDWAKNKKGTSVPVSDEQLRRVKDKWRDILIGFSRQHKIDWSEGDIDAHYEFASWDKEYGKIVLMHWFNYQGRYSLEDYAKYSNNNLDCTEPPEWLKSYENRSRSFGWWRDMAVMCGRMKKEIIKRDILTGKPMKYLGKWSLWRLLENRSLGYLDIVKGQPIFHKLKGKEIYWLVSVDKISRLDENGIINLTRSAYE